jgi:hypothetical protein
MSKSEFGLTREGYGPALTEAASGEPVNIPTRRSRGIELIIVDGVENSVSLKGLAAQLEIFLEAIEIRTSSDGIETLSYNDELLSLNRQLCIEVRANDRCNLMPHCHITRNNEDASYDLEHFRWLGGTAVEPLTAEKVRRFFVNYGGGDRLALLLKPDFRWTPSGQLQRPGMQGPQPAAAL